jgi:hypothetical protein
MQTAQDLYSTTVFSMPPSERLRLAAMILNELAQAETSNESRQSIRQMLSEMPAARLFKTAAEVDAYLERERDLWER